MPLLSCPHSVEDKDVERSLDASIKDVAAYGVMMGFGEAYFSAYAVWLGASNLLMGILGAIPMFVGSCLQPLAAHIVERTGKRRSLYLGGSVVQALMLLPMCVSVLLPHATAYWVMLAALTLYFAGLHFTIPPWNSTMGDIVPPEFRGRFFGRRGSVAVLCQCLAALLAGVGLEIFKRGGHTAYAFALIFAAAFVARAISIAHLSRMIDPPIAPHASHPEAKRISGNFYAFALFVAAMHFGVFVSGPYFTVYMLEDLHFTYVEFMVSQVVVMLAPLCVLSRWGRIGDRIGNRWILVVTGVGVTIIPVLWQVAWAPWSVWLVQAFAGATWGGFNLAAGNFLLDSLPRELRARGVALYSFLVGMGILFGGLAGAVIVDLLPARYVIAGFSITFFSHLLVIMLVSCLLRALALALFLARFREVRDVPHVGFVEVVLQSAAVQSITDAAGEFAAGYRREKDDASRK